MTDEPKSTVTTPAGTSKAAELVEAARRRNKVEQEIAENASSGVTPSGVPKDDEAREAMIDAAEAKAAVKPQAVAGSLAGIDVEAMGDVKGDGGDAKNYADDDPDKALGVPTYVHGLDETTATGDNFAGTSVADGEPGEARSTRVSSRTEAEMRRGREAIDKVHANRAEVEEKRIAVTDVNDDPEGRKGAAAAEKAAKKAAKK